MNSIVAVVSMKDEAPYLLEWIAYHLSIGFDRIVAVANDCSDGTHEMLLRLQELGLIAYYENRVPFGAKPHSHALKIANASPEVQEASHAIVLDADEFLVVKRAPHDVSTLVAELEARSAEMMVIPWRLFGSSGQFVFEDAPVIQRFRRSISVDRPIKAGVKTLFRRAPRLRLAIHFPKRSKDRREAPEAETETRWIDAGGRVLDAARLTWNGGKQEIRRDFAEIAHYMIKSLDEYMLKIFRGDGLMNSSRHGVDYWVAADRNEADDLDVLGYAPRFQEVFASLRRDPILLELHGRSIKARYERIEGLMKNSSARRLRNLLAQSGGAGLSTAEADDARAITNALAPPRLPVAIVEDGMPRSLLVSIATSGLPDADDIFGEISAICRSNGAMFWSEKDFQKRPVTSLIEGLKRGKKHGRELQLTVRRYGNYRRRKPDADWPVDRELDIIITRNPENVLKGYAQYIVRSRERHLHLAQEGFPAPKKVLRGEEPVAEVERLIAAGQLADPQLLLSDYLAEHSGSVVLNLDNPAGLAGVLDGLEQTDPDNGPVVKILREALLPAARQEAVQDHERQQCQPSRPPNSSAGTAVRLAPARRRLRRIHWFRRSGGNIAGNFGDELGPMLVSALTGDRVEWASPERCDMISIGSILSQVSRAVERSGRKEEMLVWGSGLIAPDADSLCGCLRLAAVRGEMTRASLAIDPAIPTGDPGVLADFLVPAEVRSHKWGVVPHFSHRRSRIVKQFARDNDFLLIDPTDAPLEVLRKISSCHGVISSSLHGLIVAESYGLPCLWLNMPSHKHHEFKFADYCSGVGRAIFSQISESDLPDFSLEPDDISAHRVGERIRDSLVAALL